MSFMKSDRDSKHPDKWREVLVIYLKGEVPLLLFFGLVVFYLYARRGYGVPMLQVGLTYVLYALVASASFVGARLLRTRKRSLAWSIGLTYSDIAVHVSVLPLRFTRCRKFLTERCGCS